MMEPLAIQFAPDGSVVIEYVDLPGDFRDNGVQFSRRIAIPSELVATADALEQLRMSVQLALKAGVRALEDSSPMSMEELLGEEAEVDPDVAGPYDNPNER